MSAACSVKGCDKTDGKGGRGMCGMHWRRVKRTGSPGASGYMRAPGRTVEERIFERLALAGECWEWRGALTTGYGVIGEGQDLILIHRWMYEHFISEIPQGLVIDHLCCNRKCANPWHLEPVTRAENNRRGGPLTGERRRGA